MRMKLLSLATSVLFCIGCSSNGTPSIPISGPVFTDPCSSLISKPARGISALEANVPKAQHIGNQKVDILYRSCIDKPAISYLVSGGISGADFGFDAGLMSRHIEKLSRNGRKPHVEFYLTSGPNQRHNGPPCLVTGFGDCLDPRDFKKKIKEDVNYQLQFRSLMERLVPLITQVNQAGGKVYISPSLEDNLDITTYRVLLDLLQYLNIPDVIYVRNPCNCTGGTDNTVVTPSIRERHTSQVFGIPTKGVASNDGEDAVFGSEPSRCSRKFNVEHFRALFDDAGAKGTPYFAWFAKTQASCVNLKNPNERDYLAFSPAEEEQLLQILRH